LQGNQGKAGGRGRGGERLRGNKEESYKETKKKKKIEDIRNPGRVSLSVIRIREMFGSNLGRDTDIMVEIFHGFPQYLYSNDDTSFFCHPTI
jgi:hypothetical protein